MCMVLIIPALLERKKNVGQSLLFPEYPTTERFIQFVSRCPTEIACSPLCGISDQNVPKIQLCFHRLFARAAIFGAISLFLLDRHGCTIYIGTVTKSKYQKVPSKMAASANNLRATDTKRTQDALMDSWLHSNMAFGDNLLQISG